MKTLAGTPKLIRLILRRDRIVLPVWVFLFAVWPSVTASAFRGLYPTDEGLASFYQSMANNPSMTAMIGPIFGPSLGALTTWRTGVLLTVLALVSAMTVIRHTRVEEETGRRDLLGATVVGRHAPLAAAVIVVVLANLLMGTLIALFMMGGDLPAAGSVAIGLSFASAGIMFAAVAAVTAQLTETAGGARGIAIGVLGVAFLLRAAGDASGANGNMSYLSWLSPLGWAQQTRPYADERWWVFLLPVALTIALLTAAASLLARRDVGSGMFAARLGPAAAAPGLRSSFALAWRLHRGALLGWAIGFAVGGLVIGGASQSIDRMVETSPGLADMLQRLGGVSTLKETYIAGTLSILALIAGAYAVSATLRLRAEEVAMRAEPLLSASVSRFSWAASHAVFALIGPAIALACMGLTIGLSAGVGLAGVGGALAQLPAVWVLGAVAFAAFGLLPRLAAAIGWGAVGLCFLLTFLGPLLQLDQWMLDLSPFTHIPKLPGGTFTVAPLLWLIVIGTIFTVAGFAGFRRRDIVSSA